MIKGTKRLLARIVGTVAGVAIFVVALVFAWVLALIVAGVGLAAWMYLSWRMRSLAKQAARRGNGSVVIEGEYRSSSEPTDAIEWSRGTERNADADSRSLPRDSSP